MITPLRLNGITLSVRDLGRSLAWYREKFGFEILYDDAPNSSGLIIGAREIEICLQAVEHPAQARTADHPRDVCVRLIAFEITPEDCDRVAAVFPDQEIVVLDHHPRYRSRIIEDPDGHAIELFAVKTA